MRRAICALLVVLLALPVAALAESKLGDVIYGPWSGWSAKQPPSIDGLVIETRQSSQRAISEVYTYRRFEYFNTKKNMWYATSTDQPGAAMKPGTGRWVEKTFDERLPQVGIVNLARCYEGQWFFEQAEVIDQGYESVTEHRYRMKSVVRCQLGAHDAAIARGATYQLEPKVEDGLSIWYRSTNTTVATVDAKGLVRGVGIGQCEIQVMSGAERVESLTLHVGDRLAGLAAGSYSIQLIGTDEYMAPIGGVAKPGAMLFTSNYIPAELRYFKFQGVADSSFQVRLVSPQMLYVSVRAKDRTVGLNGRSNKLGQAFSILRLKGGQDLIYLSDDPTRFLAVSRTGQLEMRAFESLSTTIRWKLTKEGEAEKAPPTWAVPYQRNGKCYVSQNYKAGVHNGIDIGSYGERVPALSVAPGVVTYTYSGCTHDYGKPTNADGKQIDPCGDSSFGNIVIVQHANGLQTAYAHLSRVMVNKGDRVNQGDILGMTGSTGSSTAVHLHFEVRDSGNNTLNPRQFIDFPKLIPD